MIKIWMDRLRPAGRRRLTSLHECSLVFKHCCWESRLPTCFGWHWYLSLARHKNKLKRVWRFKCQIHIYRTPRESTGEKLRNVSVPISSQTQTAKPYMWLHVMTSDENTAVQQSGWSAFGMGHDNVWNGRKILKHLRQSYYLLLSTKNEKRIKWSDIKALESGRALSPRWLPNELKH